MNVSNEVIMNELGIMSIEGEVARKVLRFRMRVMWEQGTLNERLVKVGIRAGLGWEVRCRNIMAKYGISEVDRTTLDREGRAYVEKWLKEADSRIILLEREERTRAMMGKKTTAVYRQLTEGLDLRMPMYLGNNQAESLAAALIFQMRAGSNFTARCQFVQI